MGSSTKGLPVMSPFRAGCLKSAGTRFRVPGWFFDGVFKIFNFFADNPDMCLAV